VTGGATVGVRWRESVERVYPTQHIYENISRIITIAVKLKRFDSILPNFKYES
jgi:hypothetical protein